MRRPASLLWIAAGFAAMSLAGVAWAHTGHDSVTEAVFRPESGMLEVTVSVHAGDLEEALVKREGRRVRVHGGQDRELDRRLADYLREVFWIEDQGGERPELGWVGRELKEEGNHAAGGVVLLHFELPLPGGLGKIRLGQNLLCEVHEDQINLVHLRDGEKRVTLGFSPAHGPKEVDFTRQAAGGSFFQEDTKHGG